MTERICVRFEERRSYSSLITRSQQAAQWVWVLLLWYTTYNIVSQAETVWLRYCAVATYDNIAVKKKKPVLMTRGRVHAGHDNRSYSTNTCFQIDFKMTDTAGKKDQTEWGRSLQYGSVIHMVR